MYTLGDFIGGIGNVIVEILDADGDVICCVFGNSRSAAKANAEALLSHLNR